MCKEKDYIAIGSLSDKKHMSKVSDMLEKGWIVKHMDTCAWNHQLMVSVVLSKVEQSTKKKIPLKESKPTIPEYPPLHPEVLDVEVLGVSVDE